VEWLKYEFLDEKESSAAIAVEWEKQMIPFTVTTDLIPMQLESFRRELRSDKGFNWNAWDRPPSSASSTIPTLTKPWLDQYSHQRHLCRPEELPDPLHKAQILVLQGKKDEADAIMKEALPLENG